MVMVNSLSVLLPKYSYRAIGCDAEVTFADLVDDTREVKQGDLFVTSLGEDSRVAGFLNQAKASGAVAALLSKAVDCDFPQVVVDDVDAAVATITKQVYGNADQVVLIGITGTDGKTSVATMVSQAIAAVEGDCGISGTIAIGSIKQPETARLTTPSNLALKRWLSHLADVKCRSAVMEVSSHALSQQRVAGLSFAVAVLTNLGRDHLDYHGSLVAYHQAKAALFTDYHAKAAVYLEEDPAVNALLADFPETQKWRVEENLQNERSLVVGERVYQEGLEVTIQTGSDIFKCSVPLVGEFQYKNVAITVQIMRALGFDPAKIQCGLAAIEGIPGRMEVVKFRANAPMVVVDYSHTDQAIANALQALRSVAADRQGVLAVVFGCGGDRDAGKRPAMAAAAEKNADKVYLTSDNPRTEAPEKIIAEAMTGFVNPSQAVCEIDRRKAIFTAIQSAAAADVVLIAGKGHETYQEINEKRYPFSDSEVALSALEELWR